MIKILFVPEHILIMAGLLTFSIFTTPSHPPGKNIGEQWQSMPENSRRLQQRVLSRIFTWFPIILTQEFQAGTITHTNIGKTLG
jgi:hypothetical protein